ncbi:addiction module antidote protein, HigA family [Salmonella enterica subsp. enterica]|nr:addiction module antidote protein, HigA family [Salmonella enterica subsp. enterica]
MTEIYTPPAHPGEALGEELFRRGMTYKQAADLLGLNPAVVQRAVSGRNALMPSVAYRLELAGVGTAREWLDLQAQYTVWQLSLLNYSDVQPFPPRDDSTGSA